MNNFGYSLGIWRLKFNYSRNLTNWIECNIQIEYENVCWYFRVKATTPIKCAKSMFRFDLHLQLFERRKKRNFILFYCYCSCFGWLFTKNKITSLSKLRCKQNKKKSFWHLTFMPNRLLVKNVDCLSEKCSWFFKTKNKNK